MASIRDTLANLVEQYKASDTPLANLMRGDTEGAKQSAVNALQQVTQDPYSGLNVLGTTKIVGKTAQELAHELAQKNAVEMLGLPKGNTAMDRAKALGFNVDEPLYHGTRSDIKELRQPRDLHESFYTTRDPNYAGNYTTQRGIDPNTWETQEGGNIIPLIGKPINNPYPIYGEGKPFSEEAKNLYMKEFIKRYPSAPDMIEGQSFQDYLKTAGRQADYLQGKKDVLETGKFFEFSGNLDAKKKALDLSGYGGVGAGQHRVYLNPQDVRSRFAAFDPARANEPDLLAGAMALPIATDEDKRNKIIELLKNK